MLETWRKERGLADSFCEQGTLAVNFVESWTYSACLDIVAAIEAKLASQHASMPSVALVAVKAELLELAKKQVRAQFLVRYLETLLTALESCAARQARHLCRSLACTAPFHNEPERSPANTSIRSLVGLDAVDVGAQFRDTTARHQTGSPRCDRAAGGL